MSHEWRLAQWPPIDDDETEQNTERERTEPSSILWQYGGGMPLPSGRFQVLFALTRSYLCRKPPARDLWLDMLIDHVERQETVKNWRAMCVYLVEVRFCSDRKRAQLFLARLFERFPRILASQDGVRLISYVAHLLTDEQRQEAYSAVLAWGEHRGTQAFGELVCHHHLLHIENEWSRTQVNKFLTSEISSSEEVCVGIAFSASNLWKQPECRNRATEILAQSLTSPSDAVAYAAMSVFLTRDQLPLDDATLILFRQVAAHPDVLVRANVNECFFDNLLDAFVVDTELVCKISEEAVCRRGGELQSVRHRLYMAGSALIDISLRLQRSGGDYRRRGMALFESLLDLGVNEAISIARINDHRLIGGNRPIRRLRRK